jgi:hypothetical protein
MIVLYTPDVLGHGRAQPLMVSKPIYGYNLFFFSLNEGGLCPLCKTISRKWRRYHFFMYVGGKRGYKSMNSAIYTYK